LLTYSTANSVLDIRGAEAAEEEEEEKPTHPSSPLKKTGLYHPVMSVIVAAKKVRYLPLDSCYPGTQIVLLLSGHWIKDCPTNNDREFDNRPRIKRTTGIPRSMLKAVDNPTTEQFGQGVMVTPEGGYVVAQPDS